MAILVFIVKIIFNGLSPSDVVGLITAYFISIFSLFLIFGFFMKVIFYRNSIMINEIKNELFVFFGR